MNLRSTPAFALGAYAPFSVRCLTPPSGMVLAACRCRSRARFASSRPCLLYTSPSPRDRG
eukprot:3934335-Rhodomonas_salina.5